MNRLFLLLSLCCGPLLQAQYQEFQSYPNGLIYSDADIGKLKHIVDSLNLKFKVCDPKKVLLACKQGKGDYFFLEGKQAKVAKKDMEAGMPFAEISKKYPKAETYTGLHLLEEPEQWDERYTLGVSAMGFDNYGAPSVSKSEKNKSKFPKLQKGKWFFNLAKPYSSDDEFSISGFYITEVPQAKPIPQKYARMILYSECLIDTTAQVFLTDKDPRFGYASGVSQPELFTHRLDSILKRPRMDYSDAIFTVDTTAFVNVADTIAIDNFAVDTMAIGDFDDTGWKEFRKRDSIWQTLYFIRLDSINRSDASFRKRLQLAYDKAKTGDYYEDRFESIIGYFYSKAEELELKRNRRVVGGCSMDQRPRIHAQQIALLAAETTKWEIFLRSHLNIMNDRFDRVSDGSWAWKDRQTYIRELEVLDIDVPDLVLGTSLRVDNVSGNHYFSSIGRVGRALSESKDRELIANRLLEMIRDQELDSFNRILMYYMFDNLNYATSDLAKRQENLDKLAQAVATLPQGIEQHIKVESYESRR